MAISKSEVLDFLRAIESQQHIQNSTWITWQSIARGKRGPDDVDILKGYGDLRESEEYISTKGNQVKLTKAGRKAVEKGLGTASRGSQRDSSESGQRGSSDEASGSNPFLDSWLVEEQEVPIDTGVLSGHGPFKRGKLWTYLRDHFEITVGSIEEIDDPDLLVLGWRDSPKKAIRSFLKDQQGDPLRICSQEMLLSWIYTGVDPNSHPECLGQYIEGHAMLEYVRDLLQGRWPETGEIPPVASEAEGKAKISAGAEEGPLKRFGYSVGQTGRPRTKRRKALRRAFSRSLDGFPGNFSDDYLREWGAARSGKRLEKIARSIASFCRNAKRRKNPPIQAIGEWENDLEWLKNELYHPLSFGFNWPSP